MKQKLLLLILVCLCLFSAQRMMAQTTALTDNVSVISEIPVPVHILNNDSYTCESPIISVTVQPVNGTVNPVAAGDTVITYTSNTGYTGTDQLTYQIDCNGMISTATVQIMVADKPDNLVYSDCFSTPPANSFDLTAKYEVNGNDSYPIHTMATPLVGDVNGDGIVEIVAPRVLGQNLPYYTNGFIIINGKDGSVIKDWITTEFSTHGQPVAMADVDGNGYAELFIQDRLTLRLYCYDFQTYALKFTIANIPDAKDILQLVDINNDGDVELVAGSSIYDAKTGTLLLKISWPQTSLAYGSPHNMTADWYNLFAMTDIDGDGDLEQAAGPYVFDIDLSTNTSMIKTTAITTGMNAGSIYGQTMALDFDGDGEIEIVVLGQPIGAAGNIAEQIEIYVYKPSTGEVISRRNWTGTVGLTIPYAGDLDGNGTPEVIFADGNNGTYGMTALTYDESSNGTAFKNMRIMHQAPLFRETAGFTVFDFNQDGKIEIVYRGAGAGFYIVDGTTLTNLSTPITNVYSGTVAEYPLVADVDGDGHADIITVSADITWGTGDLRGKLRVYESLTPNAWASAKSVWNSWGYTPVSINEDLTVPKYQINPATTLSSGKKPYNLFLAQTTTVNQEGDLLFQTPNPTAGLMDYTYDSETDVLTVSINVNNKGAADLGPEIYASLYNGDYASTNFIANGSITSTVSPGDSATVTITVNTASNHMPFDNLAIRVNDDGAKFPVQSECDTTDNKQMKTEIIFYQATYDGNASDGGMIPADNQYYQADDSVLILPAGNMSRTDATFIGWTFTNPAPGIVTSEADVPANLVQPADSFEIVSDTVLYAVWAEDKRGTEGEPDSIPDYLQYEVIYDKTLATAGTEPIDGNLYNTGNPVIVKANEGGMALDSTCFIGWSFVDQTAIVTTAADVPADRINPSQNFTILSDTILYAIWAEDKSGNEGIPDSIPDYLQYEVSYDKTLATAGTEPIDGNLYNTGDPVIVKANKGGMTLDSTCFIGWSFVDQTAIVTTAADVPADRIDPLQNFTVLSDTILYAIWAEDKSGNTGIPDSIPDYLQYEVIYDGNANTGGSVPADSNLYNTGNSVTIYGNTGILEKTNACFIGWSFVQKPVITTTGDVPADLKQGGETFTISSDTICYAVWAEDNSGPAGTPDSIPDYLQLPVIYDGNGHTGGAVPVDANLYDSGNSVTIYGNTGILEKTNACFIGWSYTAHLLIQTENAVPADLSQGGDIFTITTPVTFYAVWAEDNNGSDGVSDSIPDYLQVKLTYHQNTAYPDNSCAGSLPSPNPTMHTKNTMVVIKGNTGGLCRNPAEQLVFAGWSQSDNWNIIESAFQKPADMVMAGDIIPVATTNIDLYLVWAYDRNENGVPDYNEPNIAVTPEHKWPEKDDQEEDDNFPSKPEWKPEYDYSGASTWYAGCDMRFTMTVDPDPYTDRTFTINYLGALYRELVVGTDGNPLAESFTLPKGESVYTIKFSLTEIPADLTGMTGAIEAVIAGGGKDTSAWMNLYNHPSYDIILVKPVVKADNTVDFGITGGSPNLMRSINGRAWVNAYTPLSSMEQLSVNEGVSIWLREPNGCWEEQFFFMDYTDPEIQRYVDLPNLMGVTTNPGAGKHYVKGHKDFSFTASYTEGIPLKVMALGFYSGKYEEIIGKDLDDGTYSYTLHQVVEPWTISFGPDPASEITGDDHIDGLSAWTYKNTLHIRSDAKRTAFIYAMSGSLYKRMDVFEGDNKLTMDRGIYVVVIDNKRYKVIIR